MQYHPIGPSTKKLVATTTDEFPAKTKFESASKSLSWSPRGFCGSIDTVSRFVSVAGLLVIWSAGSEAGLFSW